MIGADKIGDTGGRRPAKSEAAFRTISEVSEDLDVPQHVLRFWEGKFPQIRPLKRGGGRRYYRPEDLQLLRRIRDLLYKDGYTIRGVQKLLREQSRGGMAQTKAEAPPSPSSASSALAEQDEPPAGEAGVAAAPTGVPPVTEAVEPMEPMEPMGPADLGRRAELESLLADLVELRAILVRARRTND